MPRKKMNTEKLTATPLSYINHEHNAEVIFNESPRIFYIPKDHQHFSNWSEKIKKAIKESTAVKIVMDTKEILSID